MENVTYAKIMGLARDEEGRPAFGYMKLEGVKLQKDTVAQLMHTTPDTVVMLTAEEYHGEMNTAQLEPGDAVWVVERDEAGSAYDVSGFMFLAKVCNYAIVTSYINDATTALQNLAELSRETANNEGCSLYVFPAEDVFETQDKAYEVLQTELEEADE